MSFDIVERFPDKAWLDEMAAKLHTKMTYAVGKAREVDYIPYSTENGQWKPVHIHWWTNGFWPATMWQMYLATKDELYRDEAIRAEKMLDVNLVDFEGLSHDVGFMWLIQSGVRYALEGNKDSYARTMKAAQHLACRYNPNGFIRAWNGEGRQGWAIVDCMMNLPLLYWASEVTGDPRFRLIAMKHADTAMQVFVRPDGSCNHIIIFDAETGEVLDHPGGQGYESGSSWSRGQAWALYGFTLSAINTGEERYLNVARKCAKYFISHIREDGLTDSDFCQPAGEERIDNIAGACAACGLLELAGLTGGEEGDTYRAAAMKLLRALNDLCADWSEDAPGILQKCTASYHDDGAGRHVNILYGDYFFVEALCKLRGTDAKLWWAKE